MTKRMLNILSRQWVRVGLPLLILAMLASACKEEENIPAPIFPNMLTLQGKAGDVLDLAFHVEGVRTQWELSSSKPTWCRLSGEGQKDLPSVIGMGSQGKVQVHIQTDQMEDGEFSKAELTLYAAGQSQVIATVIRTNEKMQVQVYQDKLFIPEGGTILIGSEGTGTFHITTEQGIPNLQHSNWFDVALEEGIYTLTLHEDRSMKYAIPAEEGFVEFSWKVGEGHRYLVAFKGMDEKTIHVTGYTYQPEGLNVTYHMSPYNWNVTEDGRRMSAVRPNGDIVEVQDVMQVQVEALNDDVVFAQLMNEEFSTLNGKEFFHITQKEGEVNITVDALPANVNQRKAAIYAFPSAQWAEMKTMTADKDDDFSTNAIFSFVQQRESNGFEIEYYNWSTYEMENVEVNTTISSIILERVKLWEAAASIIYLANITHIPANQFTNCRALTVAALMKSDEWDSGTTERNYALIDLTTGEDMVSNKQFSVDPGLNDINMWQFDMAIPATHTSPLLLVIYDHQDRTKVVKALVIEN